METIFLGKLTSVRLIESPEVKLQTSSFTEGKLRFLVSIEI